MISALDENIGRLMAEIKSLGMEENTIVIFMSDNGGLSTLRTKSAPTANLPLRAGKGWCYEGGIRVPMIIKAPGITSPGSRCTFPVISHDFFPTMLQLAKLPLSPQQHRDGKSLVPLLEGKKTLERKALFWHYPHYHGSTWTPGAAVRAGDWKLITFYEENKTELYYLADDPGERNDLAENATAKKNELLTLLEEWQKTMDAKLPLPRINQ
jgi:arylsulfatase A-like enzyme